MGDEDKQFEASQQKLEKARKEGQVVKSKDFSTALAMIVMFFAIAKAAPFIWSQITKLFVLCYEQIPNQHLENIGYPYLLFITLLPTVLIIGPILLLAAFIGILGDMIQVGPLVTMTPLSPKLDKLNPTKYFKNIMSIKTLFELVKNILKVIILGYIGWMVYQSHFEVILGLAAMDNNFAIMQEFGNLIMDFVMKAGIAFLIIGMNGGYYLFKVSDLLHFIHTNSRKSIPYSVVLELGIPLKLNYNIGIDYLKGIDIAYKGVGYFENTKD